MHAVNEKEIELLMLFLQLQSAQVSMVRFKFLVEQMHNVDVMKAACIMLRPDEIYTSIAS